MRNRNRGILSPGAEFTSYRVTGIPAPRVPVAGGEPQRVVKAGQVSVTGMAIAGGRLFWVTRAGEGGSLSYVSLHGAPVAHTLVGNLSFSRGLVATDGWLYWADENAIGRVRPDGTQLTRRFIAPPQEYGGGVADGLGTDGQHLFFSRCQDNEIGRVDTSGQGPDLSFIKLPAKACPQALAVGNNHVYWAELGSYVGRATLQGTGASDTWLNIHSDQGPSTWPQMTTTSTGTGAAWPGARCTSAPRKWTAPDSTPASSARERSCSPLPARTPDPQAC